MRQTQEVALIAVGFILTQVAINVPATRDVAEDAVRLSTSNHSVVNRQSSFDFIARSHIKEKQVVSWAVGKIKIFYMMMLTMMMIIQCNNNR